MAQNLRKAPLSLTEHAVVGLWKEYDLCANINRDWILPFYPLNDFMAGMFWNCASPESRRRAELRYERAGSIIDLFKCDRISYREAVARIQELFS